MIIRSPENTIPLDVSRVAQQPVAWTAGLYLGVASGVKPRLVRLGADEREDADAYIAAGGYTAAGLRGTALIAAVEASGLRGRGGAAFSTGLKMRAVLDRPGPRYLIANGDEGEPASVKDRWLLRRRPHLVLDGLLRTGEAVGVERAFVVVSDDGCARSVSRALVELSGKREPGLPIEVATVDGAYVAGEETAVVRAINGGPALPVDKPPRPFEAGVSERPTLVVNVESLANVPYIAVDGPDEYRQTGTSASPGTFLLTISGHCRRPGLYEVPFGVTLRAVLEELAGAIGEPQGFLMGGFFGGLISQRALDVRLDYDELRDQGSGLGCGGVVVLGPDDCPVAAAADVMSYFARENANQCGACVRGTPAMRDAVLSLARGVDDTERLRRWSVSLRGRGACALLDAAAAVGASLLREFPTLVNDHLQDRCLRCAALIGAGVPESTRFQLSIAESS